MKKLNKLLMPIVGLSTIAATAIPLASCKNGYTDGVEVTKKEYQEAFEYLAACKEGSSWKTSTEDTIQSISVNNTSGALVNWAEYYDIAFNDDYGTAKAIGSSRSSAYETELLTSIRKNNCYFSIFEDADAEEKTHKSVSVDTTSEIQAFLVEVASYYYDYYDDGLVFDKDTKTYMYNGAKKDETTGTVMYAQSKVRFDSNKKITYINTHFGLIESTETTLMDIVLHPKYDNVKVDVDQEYKDLVETHTKEMTNNSLEVAKSGIMIKGISDKAPLLVNITPKSGNEKTLTVKCDTTWTDGVQVNGIYKNGELLEEGSDKDYEVSNGVITFKTALKTSDKINVAYSLKNISSSSITKFTFTLA